MYCFASCKFMFVCCLSVSGHKKLYLKLWCSQGMLGVPNCQSSLLQTCHRTPCEEDFDLGGSSVPMKSLSREGFGSAGWVPCWLAAMLLALATLLFRLFPLGKKSSFLGESFSNQQTENSILYKWGKCDEPPSNTAAEKRLWGSCLSKNCG